MVAATMADVLPAVAADLERRGGVPFFGRLLIAATALLVKDKALGAPPAFCAAGVICVTYCGVTRLKQEVIK